MYLRVHVTRYFFSRNEESAPAATKRCLRIGRFPYCASWLPTVILRAAAPILEKGISKRGGRARSSRILILRSSRPVSTRIPDPVTAVRTASVLRPSMLRNTIHKCQSIGFGSSYRRAIALIPAAIAFVVTAYTDFAPVNPGANAFLFWTPLEVAIWAVLAGAGLVIFSHAEMRAARERLSEARAAEETRRAISAIGVAASWDLDLDRLYQRISQDMRTIFDFDRFTVTNALPSGRMRIEFVSGDAHEGLPAGAILAESPGEPDGLHPEFRSNYRSRLTAAIPACNGTLTIRSHHEGCYTSVDLDLLRQTVAQISPGIANAILFQASKQQVRERTVLADIGRAATSALDTRAIIEAVDSALATLIRYDHLGVIFVDNSEDAQDAGRVVYWSNEGLNGWQTGSRVPFDTESVSKHDVVSGLRITSAGTVAVEEATGTGARKWLQAPLVVQEQLMGILVLSSENPDAIGADDSALLLNISLQIAPAIQNANLAASLKRQVDERRTIAAIGLAANHELMLEAIYNSVAQELAKVLQFDRLAITYLDPDEGRQEIAFVRGIEIEGLGVGDLISAESESARHLIDGNMNRSANSPMMKTLKDSVGLRSRVSVRIGAEPNILGLLHLNSVNENAYDAQVSEFLERVAIQITPAIRNARMIAAERELRETLDRQNQELFEANNARKNFLSTVSHELKTPLTIISGFVDLLASPNGSDDAEEQREALSIIRGNADQLDVLINDILDISKLDAGTFKINPLPFSVPGLLVDLEASFQSLLRTKAQTLRVEIGNDELWIDADRVRIAQIITNLLSNASKYSPEGTEITLRSHADNGRLHVSVTDQGVGMSEEEQQGLFTAFFRVDNETTRKVSGTGLGLVIAKSITELHEGDIRLESRPGEGTTIEFWIPRLMTKEAAEAALPQQQEFTGSRLWPDGPPEEIGLGAD